MSKRKPSPTDVKPVKKQKRPSPSLEKPTIAPAPVADIVPSTFDGVYYKKLKWKRIDLPASLELITLASIFASLEGQADADYSKTIIPIIEEYYANDFSLFQLEINPLTWVKVISGSICNNYQYLYFVSRKHRLIVALQYHLFGMPVFTLEVIYDEKGNNFKTWALENGIYYPFLLQVRNYDGYYRFGPVDVSEPKLDFHEFFSKMMQHFSFICIPHTLFTRATIEGCHPHGITVGWTRKKEPEFLDFWKLGNDSKLFFFVE